MAASTVAYRTLHYRTLKTVRTRAVVADRGQDLGHALPSRPIQPRDVTHVTPVDGGAPRSNQDRIVLVVRVVQAVPREPAFGLRVVLDVFAAP